MKRDKIINKHGVKSHYSLFFWNECAFCKQEFKREKGWCWTVGLSSYFPVISAPISTQVLPVCVLIEHVLI